MTSALDEYRAALRRLVDRGEKISNDAVSIEAGRKKGSIKSGRNGFTELIAEIETAILHSKFQTSPVQNGDEKSVSDVQRKLEASLAREVSLLREIRNLRRQLSKLRGGTVVPILGTRRNQS